MSPSATPNNENNSTTLSSPVKNGVVDERCIPTNRDLFFDNWTHPTALPSPAQAREASTGNNLLKKGGRGQRVVCFPALQLVVKYGPISATPVAEAQTLWLLSYVTPMRVPKLYGWCEDEGERFIYMERIQGVTVEERWSSLSAPQKLSVLEQLHLMVSSMRRLKQAPGNRYIGALRRGHIYEQVWNGADSPLGLFELVKTFTNALFALGKNVPGYPDHPLIQSLRSAFSDDASIVFTHADLHPCNIMMSAGHRRLVRCWMVPRLWEYIKASWTVDFRSPDDWKDHVGKFVQPAYEDELAAFHEYEQTWMLYMIL